jgi:hypothetical protein
MENTLLESIAFPLTSFSLIATFVLAYSTLKKRELLFDQHYILRQDKHLLLRFVLKRKSLGVISEGKSENP